jgi:hypothetical protein
MALAGRHDRRGGIAFQPTAGQCAVAGGATGALGALATTWSSVGTRTHQQ